MVGAACLRSKCFKIVLNILHVLLTTKKASANINYRTRAMEAVVMVTGFAVNPFHSGYR